jgi:hypothetical protein
MVQKLPLKMIPTNLKFEYLLLHKEINKIRIELENFEPKTKEHNEWIREKLQIYSKLYVQIQCINDKILKGQEVKLSENI